MCAGDLIWILTQSQLRAVSHLVQSLMDAAVRTYQQREEGEGVESDSEGSMESVSSDRGSHKASYHANKMEDGDKKMRKSQKKKSKSSAMKNKLVQERISQYREGKLNLPSYEVIQNSFHVKTGKVDLQLCDDMSGADMTDTVQGSMLIQVRGAVVLCTIGDHYCVCRYLNWQWMCIWISLQGWAGHTGIEPMTSLIITRGE